ncbi:MAG TPA: carboxypeptidase-like regulatory domain-containing protein, partial [Gemmatimonadaceae bacterium]
MKRLLSIVLLVAVPVVLRAQASIHGTVVEQQTGTPIAGALVVVTGTKTSAVTNDAGAFSLTADHPITSVTVASAGYVTKDVAVTNASEALHIRLTLSQTKLPGVQVIADKPT